ncbi:hypothetical protein [Mesobacillus foraminis]|nr:hypothetical protein [Mesobacillus foraminis]
MLGENGVEGTQKANACPGAEESREDLGKLILINQLNQLQGRGF